MPAGHMPYQTVVDPLDQEVSGPFDQRFRVAYALAETSDWGRLSPLLITQEVQPSSARDPIEYSAVPERPRLPALPLRTAGYLTTLCV